jgi:hypothetical protein
VEVLRGVEFVAEELDGFGGCTVGEIEDYTIESRDEFVRCGEGKFVDVI